MAPYKKKFCSHKERIKYLHLLIEKGSSVDECYSWLKKIFKDRYLTRAYIQQYIDKIDRNAPQPFNEKKKIMKKKVLHSFVYVLGKRNTKE